MTFSTSCLREEIRGNLKDKRRARSAITHATIAQTAEKLVQAEGRQALTTKRLVKEAGVSERTIFNHFTNLDAILLSRLGEHLAALVDIESFPADLSVDELPVACEEFLTRNLHDERSTDALDRFVHLAATFGTAEEAGESIGQEVFATMHQLGGELCQHIQQLYFNQEDPRILELALYIQNLLTGMVFGMARYLFENPQLAEDSSQYSSQTMREHMTKSFQLISAGRPTF